MTPIPAIINAIVSALRATPTLVSALGSPDQIVAYTDDATAHRSLNEATHELRTGDLLVAYMGLVQGARGDLTGWKHQLAIFFQPNDEAQAHSIIGALVSGVPNGSPVALQYAQIHAALDPMDNIVFARSSNAEGIEFWTCTFSLAEVWS
jgi:hypothetical protein